MPKLVEEMDNERLRVRLPKKYAWGVGQYDSVVLKRGTVTDAHRKPIFYLQGFETAEAKARGMRMSFHPRPEGAVLQEIQHHLKEQLGDRYGGLSDLSKEQVDRMVDRAFYGRLGLSGAGGHQVIRVTSLDGGKDLLLLLANHRPSGAKTAAFYFMGGFRSTGTGKHVRVSRNIEFGAHRWLAEHLGNDYLGFVSKNMIMRPNEHVFHPNT